MVLIKRLALYSLSLFLFVFFPFCSRRETRRVSVDLKEFPLFIEMPQNVTVFDNLGPVLYVAFQNHFERVGFVLHTCKEGNNYLKSKIENLRHDSKFISLDIVPYVFKVNISVKCWLFDSSNVLIEEKSFEFFKWVHRPEDALLNSDFLNFQYRELLQNSVPKIDQYFRKFILQRVQNGDARVFKTK